MLAPSFSTLERNRRSLLVGRRRHLSPRQCCQSQRHHRHPCREEQARRRKAALQEAAPLLVGARPFLACWILLPRAWLLRQRRLPALDQMDIVGDLWSRRNAPPPWSQAVRLSSHLTAWISLAAAAAQVASGTRWLLRKAARASIDRQALPCMQQQQHSAQGDFLPPLPRFQSQVAAPWTTQPASERVAAE